jgi:hypothetical protein
VHLELGLGDEREKKVRSSAFRRKFVSLLGTTYELPPEGRTTNIAFSHSLSVGGRLNSHKRENIVFTNRFCFAGAEALQFDNEREE